MSDKKETYYFSHDANALQDPKILAMRCDYGLEGYGLYWAILEMMRNDKNYKLSLNKNTYRAIKMQTGAEADIEKFIADCINEYIGSNGNGLFNSDGEYFWSESFLARMTKYEELKEKRKAAGLKGLEKRWGKKDKEENTQKKTKLTIMKPRKKIANAMKYYSKCNSNAIANAMNKNSKPVAKNSKLNEIKLNESKINNNNILLNYTKLNLLFNYLIYKENNFETLTESDRTTIIYRLKQLDLYFDFKDTTFLKYMTDPDEKIFEIKLYYWVITSIWISEYRMYFNNLNRNNFFFRFIKCKKYIPINSKSSEEELRHFVSYFMKSLMDELKRD